MPKLPKISPELVKKYQDELSLTFSEATLKRKHISIKKFLDWAESQNIIEQNPLTNVSRSKSPIQNKKITAANAGKLGSNNWYKRYRNIPGTLYLNIAVLAILSAALGLGIYNQFFKNPQSPLAYPTSLSRPNRYLSFQGRLTNQFGNPIVTATNVVFKLYDAASSGNQLWTSGTCTVSPDPDGIFSTLLGSTCGTELTSNIFSENPGVWLGVTVGTDAEATPTIQIATVAYALNSETLQGYPASASATINTIPVINNSGTMVLAASSPKIQSSSGTFAIEGQAVTIDTPTASNGNINISPDGTGQVNLIFNGASPGSGTGMVNATDANLTSGSLYYGSVASNASGYNLLQLQSGSSLTNKFVVDSAGNTTIAGTINGMNVSAGTITNATWNGNIITSTYGGTGANNSGAAQYAIPYYSTTGVLGGALSPSTGGYVLSTNSTGGAPTWIPMSATGTNDWVITAGAIHPGNTTLDLLLGSNATSSAKFAFKGVNSGTPTASISGATNIATFIDGNGNISTTNRKDLTLGNSTTYNTTGDVLLNPNGTGNVGIGTATPNDALSIVQSTTTGSTLNVSRNLDAASTNAALIQAIQANAGDDQVGFYLENNGTGGAANIYNPGTGTGLGINQGTTGTGFGINVYSNVNSTVNSPLVNINADNVAFDQQVLYISNAGTSNAIRIDNAGSATVLALNSSNTGDLITLNSTGAVTTTNGILIAATNASGVITNAINASDPEIVNAINVGANTILGTTGIIDYTNFDVDGSGNITAGGSASASGNLTLAGGARSIQTTAFNPLTIGGATTGNITLNPSNAVAGGYVAPNTTNVTDLGTSSLLFRNIYGTNIYQGVNQVCDMGGNCNAIGNFWGQALGALYPVNNTVDLLIGSNATTSAKFAFKGVNSGTPTASISGATNIATFIDGNGNISTTNRKDLTLGNSTTYNTTGDVLLNPNGTGNVGIGNVSLTQKLSVGGSLKLANNTGIYFQDNGTADSGVMYYSTGNNLQINNSLGSMSFTLDNGGDFTFQNNWAPTMTITSGNKVGIGDTTPAATLTVGDGDLFQVAGATGNITTAGTLAVNGDSITADGATLVINAGGNVDVQDALNADSITSDAGVSIAAANSYTGAGAVTLSSAANTTLTVDSGTTGALNIGGSANAKAITIGNSTTSTTINLTKGASGNIVLTGFNCSTFTNGGTLTTDSSGNITCANDDGGSAGIAWSAITDPATDLTLAMGVNKTTFNWIPTGALDAWTMSLNNNAGSATTQNLMVLKNAVSTQTTDVTTESLLLLDNADTPTVGLTKLANGILITNSGGIDRGITDAIDASATEIDNAINIGANVILGTTGDINLDNFDVTGSSGNIVTAGTLAVNGDSITADGATLIINAAGNVDVQDALKADSLSTDVGGVSIAASQSYTGLGAVTLSSAASGVLTLDSASGAVTLATDDDLIPTLGASDADIGATGTRWDNVYAVALNLSGDATISGGDITGANGAALDLGEATSGDITVTGDMIVADDSFIGLGAAAGRFTFDVTATPDTITVNDANLALGANSLTGTTGNIDLSNFDVTGSSGNIVTAGTLAVNGDSITADGATLVINAGGNVDVQDALNADNITTDVGGVTIAASQSYSGLGVVTLDSATTSNLNIGTGANSKTITIGNNQTNTNVVLTKGASGNFTLTGFNCTGNANGGALTADASGNVTCTDDDGGTGTSYWNVANGALYANNTTLDVLIGGTATSSAHFAFTGVTAGTPTASISGTTASIATYLTGNGNLATTNMQPLTIGGTTTGSVQLNPKNTSGLTVNGLGNVAIGRAPTGDRLIVGGASTATITVETNNNAGGAAYLNVMGGANATNGTVGSYSFYNYNSSWSSAEVARIKAARGAGGDAEGYLAFLTKTQAGTISEGMRIDPAGNVGIGDTSPAATLTVGNGDLFQVAGATGNITTAGALQVGTLVTPTAYTRFATGGSPVTTTHSLSTAQDVLINGSEELNGVLYLNGRNIASSNGTSTISFPSDPTAINSFNVLTNGSWLIQNPTAGNNGIAALMVDQQKGGAIFTASASGVTKFTINNEGSMTLAGLTSAATTTAGTVYYDTNNTSTGNLYLYGQDSAWHRLAMDMTKYSSTSANIANQSYIEIAHNQNTNDITALGWFLDSVSGLWKKITDWTTQTTQNLANQFNPAYTAKVKTTAVQLAYQENDFGTGADGAISISSAGTYSLNTTSYISGRSCADGGDAVNYSVTALGANTATVAEKPISSGCIAAGDEMLIINMRGTTTSVVNTGNYETLRVSSVDTTNGVVTFTTNKAKYYGSGASDDLNIGVNTTDQAVMLQRVPNYTNVTVGTGVNLTPDQWVSPAGASTHGQGEGGVLFFRANGTTTVTGSLLASTYGYIGGAGAASTSNGGFGGESICSSGGKGDWGGAGGNGAGGGGGRDNWAGGNGSCGGGGGAGDNATSAGTGSAASGGAGGGGGNAAGGGGGGHVTPGTAGKINATAATNGGDNTSGNGAVGVASNLGGGGGGGGAIAASTNLDLAKLYMGSGAGGGGNLNLAGGKGGDGGGIIFVASSALTVSGTINNNGEAGVGIAGSATYGGGGGGGAAGSTKIIGNSLTLGTGLITASGAAGGTGSYNGAEGGASAGGTGGDGRVTILYSSAPSGTTTPTYNGYTLNYNTYSVAVSGEINTPLATAYNTMSWTENLDTNGEIEVQTRSGNSTDSKDGTWSAWGGATSLSLNDANTHTDWSGTNATVADGDVTRNIDYYEDEDEFTAGNLTKISSSTSGGYAQYTYGSTWNLSSYRYVTFWARSSTAGNTLKVGISENGSTWQEENITIDAASTWQKVYWDISDIASGSRDAIKYIRLTKLGATSDTIYIDNFKAESYGTTATGQDISGTTANNYIQYRFILSTTDTTKSPTYSAVRLTYNGTTVIDADNVRTISDPYYYSSSRNRLTNVDLANYKDIRSITGTDYFGQRGQYDPGTGADGAISISSAGTYSLNTTSYIASRSCADGGDAVNYSVTALTTNTATLESNPSSGCLAIGDEVLLINLRGTTASVVNTGNYETLRVASVVNNVVNFQTAKTKFYGSGTNDDVGIGLDTTSQVVMLQRVPNYTNVTIASGVTVGPDDWQSPAGAINNGQGEGGVLFFRANGTVSIGGSLSTLAKGYIGGPAVLSTGGGTGGESICSSGGVGGNPGAGANGAGGGGGTDNFNGGNGLCGGGGGAGDSLASGGTGSAASGGAGGGGGSGGGAGGGFGGAGGGGYISTTAAGAGGENTSANGSVGTGTTVGGAGGGGGTYGVTDLSKLYFGSAGGAGGQINFDSGKGGDGGGILVVAANSLSVSGSINGDGEAGSAGTSGTNSYAGGGGGGAGGSIKLSGNSLSLGTGVTASAGGGGNGYFAGTSGQSIGGNGGVGRIAVYSAGTITGSTTPTAAVASTPSYNYSLFISDEIATPNATEYSKIKWTTNLNGYGMVQMQTRSGKSNNSTDGSWEAWKPVVTDTNRKVLQSMDTHTDWTSGGAPNDITVADGGVARDVNYFEDENETTTGNMTKLSSVGGTTGYAEATITSANLSNLDYITAWVNATASGNLVKLGFGEAAGTEQEKTFYVDNSNTWQKIYWDISNIDPSLRNAVTKLRITVPTVNTTVYVDNITADRYLKDASGSVVTSTPNEYIQYRAILTTSLEGYYPEVHNVVIEWANGYKLVQTDANTVRLYNFTGQTQNIRLDAVVFGADLAEYYTVDDQGIGAADVVAVTGNLDDYGVPVLRKSNGVNDTGLIGIISTKAGQTLGLEGADRRLLALAGRVPVKVASDSAAIKNGDFLTASGEPGRAKKASLGEKTIGTALESWSPEGGKGEVLVLISNGNFLTPTLSDFNAYKLNAMVNAEKIGYQITDSVGSTVNNIGVFSQALIANLSAGTIETKELAANSFTAFQGTIDNMLIKSGLVAGNIQTKLISPMADGTDVTVKIGSDATPSGKFAIQNSVGAEVASIDELGNATFSGVVRSQNIDAIEALLTQVTTDQSLLFAATASANLTATGSANLSDLIATNMYITNQATMNSVSITDSLTLGSDLVIGLGGNTINSLSAPLQIQSLAMAPVEIMGGLVSIDTHGNMQIAGNLAVAGRIKSNGLTLKDNPTQNIDATSSASLLSLENTNGVQVSSVDASGSANFNSIAASQFVVAAGADATNSAVINGVITTNATAGSAKIPAGVNEITIRNPKVTDYTLVYVTPTSPTQNNVLYVKSKAGGQFVVGFTNAIDTDANFNWWIVQVQ